jgi:hypothetical protein
MKFAVIGAEKPRSKSGDVAEAETHRRTTAERLRTVAVACEDEVLSASVCELSERD